MGGEKLQWEHQSLSIFLKSQRECSSKEVKGKRIDSAPCSVVLGILSQEESKDGPYRNDRSKHRVIADRAVGMHDEEHKLRCWEEAPMLAPVDICQRLSWMLRL